MRQKRFLLLYLVFIITCFNSCFQLNHNDTGIWFYTYSNKGTSTEYNLTPASFLCLNPDKTYTLDFGKFEYGKWMKKADTLILNNSSGITEAFIIDDKKGNNLKLSTEPGVICDFEVQPYSFSANAASPFSIQNNKWRMTARRKETPAEIKSRLTSHCKFWKEYFTWALDNSIETVDVRSTPTPIKIYGNGFALKEFDDLPVAWKNYFYDSADCKLANDILEDIFTHNDIAWAHTDNKYKMFIGAFEQLEQMLAGKLAKHDSGL